MRGFGDNTRGGTDASLLPLCYADLPADPEIAY
jgi:hypothetical protein